MIWLLLALLLVPSLVSAQAFPSVSQVDNFTRANEGPPPSSSWTVSRNTGHKVVSNQCAMNDETVSQGTSWNTFSAADVEMAAKIGTVPPAGKYMNLYARLQTANAYTSNMYQVDVYQVAGASNDSMEFWKQVTGVFTQLGATVNLGVDLASTDVWGGRLVGTTIEGFLNGTSKGSRTDSDIAGAGYVGISNDSNSTGVRYTRFWAGAYVAGPASRRMLLGVGK
jgi:hypothetical protein